MPLLALLLSSGFSGIVAFLAQFVTKKIAVGAALGAFMIAGWVALQLALKALWSGISYTMPSMLTGPLGVLAYLLPDNFDACVAACMGALFARFVWDAQREWAKAVAAV